MRELNNRELFIRDKFGLSEDIVLQISEIGNNLDTNKYNVWLAREIKKDFNVLEKYQDISNVVDWAKNNKIDIMRFSFDQAKIEQDTWHQNKVDYTGIKEKIASKEIDENRIIFISSDGKYFFYLLKVSDLDYEGSIMDHCVSKEPVYADKIKKNKVLIISLRDEDNIPHATLEIDAEKGKSLQIRGKKNHDLSKKLNKILIEFVLYVSDFDQIENKEILNLINLSLKFF